MDKLESYSRLLASATTLGENAQEAHRFCDKAVLLTGEGQVLRTPNGSTCLQSSLRLLVRICSNVTVWLPDASHAVVSACRSEATRIAFAAPVRFAEVQPCFDQFDAILNVGTRVVTQLPWTVINSDGWLARVSSGATALPSTCDQANPIAALAAASLGTAEVFKRLLRVKAARGPLVDGLQFSLFTYEGSDQIGPELSELRGLDLLVVGAGAIGNGVVYLLHQLRGSGRVLIVDPQQYEPPNLGTCMLIGPQDLRQSKALHAAKLLGTYQAQGFHEALESFSAKFWASQPYPSVIVGGLDNIDARHQLQNLWPDLAIDGAIGPFMCQVSRHPWGEDVACLQCLFRLGSGESAEKVASRATGLSEERVRLAGDQSVTLEDVIHAPDDKQLRLHAKLGQRICSVVQESLAQEVSSAQQRKGFQPSVPFVAAMSASMVVGELAKHMLGLATPLRSRFQFDVLQGPLHGQAYDQERRRDCVCVCRARNIEKFRTLRVA